MAHFTRVRDTGMWTVGVLTPAELETFDAHQFAAVNGDTGGTWAPSSQIVIGGSGLQVTGAFSAIGNTAFGSSEYSEHTFTGTARFVAASFSGSSTFSGLSTFNANVVLGDASADTLTVNATSTFFSPATFSSAATFTGGVVIGDSSSDTLTVWSTASFGSRVNANEVVLQVGGSGLIVSTFRITSDYNTNLGQHCDRVICQSGVLSTARVLTFVWTPTIDGETVRVINMDTTHAISVSPAGYAVGGSSAPHVVDFVWNNSTSSWEALKYSTG